ncbi:sodium:calcium antiporter [Candidatus Igneacidithiobacillus taiwanensis]|uniref:sodium:calcium antiporter n=1 Tax=Candidatus Igneacidithiobacillus taiwanensis TaxID=1945924 RepID=UPI002897DBB7|nr:sodium:calcium antiporter [Candidatus Igneacidithiobacillus taiwanensis]MCE5360309.1 sodium:calcium antiporter [Acidithiobacillus sp.]
MDIVQLLLALVLILLAAELFTNSLEHLGDRLGLSEGVTGSIFAAVGTALPETMVPLVAVFASSSLASPQVGEEVGVGAILGAPMMLSTLTLFLMSLFAAKQRGWLGTLTPERSGLRRDLSWFLAAFFLATVALFIPHHGSAIRGAIAIVLVLFYFFYLLLTLRASAALVADGHQTEAEAALYLTRLGLPDWLLVILLQLGLGLAGIIYGAELFVHGVEHLSKLFGISALLLSLLIVPIATELPEKINSILWIRRKKDTLAFGNITGALVFQGSLLPAIGVSLTPWTPTAPVLVGALLTLTAGAYTLILALRSHPLRPVHFVLNGALYGIYFVIIS